MSYEDELKKAYEAFGSTVSGTPVEKYSEMLSFHINEMEKYADGCQFSEVAQHMRELGDEAKSLEAITDNLKKTKVITSKKGEEIADKLTDLWEKLDLFLANELVENCNCKMRSINY